MEEYGNPFNGFESGENPNDIQGILEILDNKDNSIESPKVNENAANEDEEKQPYIRGDVIFIIT